MSTEQTQKEYRDAVLQATADLHDRNYKRANRFIKKANTALEELEQVAHIGQAVIVQGGKYNGCILTYIGIDKLTGMPICQHSEYPGGLRVPAVTLYIA